MARFGGRGEEARVLGEEARRRLSGHYPARDTQAFALIDINPPGPLEQSRGKTVGVSGKAGRSEFGGLREQNTGVPRGKALLVAGPPGDTKKALFLSD